MDLTREQARAWMDRWKGVQARSIEELRALTPAEKLTQLNSLMRSASMFPRSNEEAIEDREVLEMWMLIRRRLDGK